MCFNNERRRAQRLAPPGSIAFGPSAQMRGRDEIHEQPDARRCLPAGQERSEQIDGVAPVVGQAFGKPSGSEILLHVPELLQREALPLERPRMQLVAAAAR